MTTETEDRAARRARMLEKVRKLLAMARDGRGNEQEAETAMRQANKLMAEFGIAEAEADLAAMDQGEMVFGECQSTPEGRAPENGKVHRQIPLWVSTLSIGVARFCDAVVIRRGGVYGEILVFRGEREDVLFARWILGVLIESINREQRASGWTSRGESNSFKLSAAATLSRRLKNLASDREAIYKSAQETSGSRALVVVDRKRAEVAERFGEQKFRNTNRGRASVGASMAGQDAGRRINIPSGRPIEQSKRAAIGN